MAETEIDYDETEERAVQDQWHLDKKVPIAIVVTIFLQTIGLLVVGISWKADVDHRLAALETSDSKRSSQETRIVILEQKLQFITKSLGRIEDKIDQIPRHEAEPRP